ncbi:MAG: hypothetical protein U1F83_13280 [Verrucomicrobiota bacterium]
MRTGETNTVYATPSKGETKWYERKALRKIQVAPVQPAIIYEVGSNSPVAAAGRNGDEIIRINGV